MAASRSRGVFSPSLSMSAAMSGSSGAVASVRRGGAAAASTAGSSAVAATKTCAIFSRVAMSVTTPMPHAYSAPRAAPGLARGPPAAHARGTLCCNTHTHTHAHTNTLVKQCVCR